MLPKERVTRETGGQSKVTQAYCWVSQNKACLLYACRAGVKTSSSQKLETGLVCPASVTTATHSQTIKAAWSAAAHISYPLYDFV